MPLPNLNVITLPDLGGPQYPQGLTHGIAPGCVDPGEIESKACWPFGALLRVRPFAMPTTPLGVLQVAFLRIRNLFPVPPSIGVHCPTVIAPAPTVVMGGSVPTWNRSVVQPPSDACQITINDFLEIPCFSPGLTGGNITDSVTSAVVGSLSVHQTGAGCSASFEIRAAIDMASAGAGAPRVGLNFLVGGDSYLWASSLACSTTCQFAPGADIPDLVDTDGILVTAGTDIGSGISGSAHVVANGELGPILCGDRVQLVLVVPGSPNHWKAYKKL